MDYLEYLNIPSLLCVVCFPDQVGKVQKEEAGSPEVRSFWCFSMSKAQEVTCKWIHNSDMGGFTADL